MTAPEVFAAALAVALGATPVAILVARRVGIVDRPGELKPQAQPVAYLGGAAVGAGMCLAASGRPLLLLPPLLAMVLGLADDCTDLPVAVRLVAELAVGVLVAATGHLLAHPLRAVVAILATVALTNAVNLVDGIDGLASGVAVVAALAFGVMLGGGPRALAAALAGALIGFLAFNRPPARVYLGDAGSYLIGVTLAELVVARWASGPPRVAVASLIVVAYPAGELVCSVVRRWRAGRPLLVGDRDHSYDRLVAAGWPVSRVSGLAAVGQLGLDGVALVAGRLSLAAAMVAVAAVVVALAAGAAATGLLTTRPVQPD